jgi:pyruvate-formate lyase-activating enzyme
MNVNYEIDNKPTTLFYVYGCNLNCISCFNKQLLKPPIDYLDKQTILSYIKHQVLTDFIVFSGGEFLSNSIYELEMFLGDVNRIFKGKIIIYTNGFYPLKMEQLRKYVDGYHCDYKLPFHQIEIARDNFLIKEILGKKITEKQRNNCIDSIKYLGKSKTKYDLVRTVKHNFLSEDALKEIKRFINIYKLPYTQNEFIETE